MKTVLIGAGGHGKAILDILKYSENFAVRGIEFLDDNKCFGESVMGYSISGKIRDCADMEGAEFIIAIGNNKVRRAIAEKYDLNYITVIHPSAVIGENVKIGRGSVIMDGAIIKADSVIGEHCIINTGATIDHECKIGDFVHVGPGVHCGGRTVVGDDVWIGIGASVINDIRICRESVIGAGAAVVRDISKKGKYVGVPAKKVE